MLHDLLVFVSVWVALLGWFLGSAARAVSKRTRAESVYRLAWLIGALAILVHILASYGLVHHWNHRAAIRVTADEAERVTGIRAGWGVYVNFLFVATWLGYVIAMLIGHRRYAGLDTAVFVFTALIVFSATVIFEAGLIRYLAAAGFIALAALAVADRQNAGSSP